MTRHEKILSIAGLAVFAALVVIAFRAYFTPAMLVEFVMRICS
jgi:hypothetical protein